MGMGYNTSWNTEGGGARAEAGEYIFKVDNAEEVQFRSGSHGCKLTLLVGAFADRDIKVFDNLVYCEGSAWKIRQCLEAVGLRYEDQPDAVELIGRTGNAWFEPNEKGYLEVKEYRAPANNGPDTRATKPASKPAGKPSMVPSKKAGGYDYGPPPMDEEEPPPF